MFYFTARDGTKIYVGKDKFENEELIKYGWPEDIWFHVDDLSSAHVYVRLERGQGIDDMSKIAIEDCCQLVKFRSIEGKKRSEVTVIYTPWSNLKKREGMDVGTIGFHNEKTVRKCKVTRDKDILRALGKTMEEKYPNLAQEKERRDQEERKILNEEKRKRKQKEKEEQKEKEKMKSAEQYDFMFDDTRPGTSTSDLAGVDYNEYEDDFM